MSARHPAAFINAIADEGTKDEAVKWLQSTWDDFCDLREAASLGAEALEAARFELEAGHETHDKCRACEEGAKAAHAAWRQLKDALK